MPRLDSAFLIAAVAMLTVACADGNTDDNETGGSNEGGSPDTGGTDEGGENPGGANEGGDGGAGGSPPVDPHCEPDDGELIGESCGVFVDPSASSAGNGTQASPFRTLEAALENAGGDPPRIYVCTGALNEVAVLPPASRLHGGILCEAAGWSWYLDVRTEWTAGPREIPLTVQGSAPGGDPTIVTGFDITAADGDVVGASSIAAIASGGAVAFQRVSLTAGIAQSGQPTLEGQSANGMAGFAGEDATNAFDGGAGGPSSCGSTGGEGGVAIGVVPTDGGEGEPDQLNGGDGSSSACTNGGVGVPGTSGASGPDAVGPGLIDAAGFHTADGVPGVDGVPGGGAGGGGAVFNHAGGGGGAGGCGGVGGVAGSGGGSSMALLILDALVAFEDVDVAVGTGGDGGYGWAGGIGGTGAPGGQGHDTACDGGVGGVGGNGGNGGSGGGGHAVLIAHTATVVPVLDGLSYDEPVPAQAGEGRGSASPGFAGVTLAFTPAE